MNSKDNLLVNLTPYGWNSVLESHLDENEVLARLTAVHRSEYLAVSHLGELRLQNSGKFENQDNPPNPSVGDWVKVTPPYLDENNKLSSLLLSVLPRKTFLSRLAPGSKISEQVIASNIDIIFIATSANQEFSLSRIQRYLVLTQNGGIQPVILLTKSDLCQDVEIYTRQIRNALPNIPVSTVSTLKKEGFDELKPYLKAGTTVLVVGSSGVGKSTLINHLIGKNIQETQTIRDGDSKGRHTTTSREMFLAQFGGVIIDTPGLREIQVVGTEEDLNVVFSEIEMLSKSCRFADCKHESEPNCAIQKALTKGTLSKESFNNFKKLQKELAYTARKLDKSLESNTKKRWKQIHKNMRQRKKFQDNT